MNFHAHGRENMLAGDLHNKPIFDTNFKARPNVACSELFCGPERKKTWLIAHSSFFKSEKNRPALQHMIGITQFNER